MRGFAGIILMAVAAVPNGASGEVDPDDSFGDANLNPYGSYSYGYRGSFDVRPSLSYSYQPLDCDKAGTANPTPISPRDLGIGLRTNRFGSLGTGAAASPYRYSGGVKYDPFVAATLEARRAGAPGTSARTGTDTGGSGLLDPPRIGVRYDLEMRSGLWGWNGGAWSPGLFGVYGRGHTELGDVLPGEGGGRTPQLRNHGADRGPTQGRTGTGDLIEHDTFNDVSIEDLLDVDQSLEDLLDVEITTAGSPPVADGINAAIGDALRRPQESAPAFGNFNSVNLATPIGHFPSSLDGFVNQQYTLGGTEYTSLLFPEQYTGDIVMEIRYAGFDYFFNPCWTVQLPSDPNFLRSGRHGGNSWGEQLDDQWAIKRVGLTSETDSAWKLVPADPEPVVVAVIDTGLDWHHLDIDPDSIWRNRNEIAGNGVDDDQNGYVDDVIGWDFVGKHGRPWDFDGHGTLVAGIIGAAHNDTGIAGINPHARLMVLKAVNNFGTTRPSYIAEAIVYAVDNGAKIVNISVGGRHASRMVQAAVDFAHQQGVLVVAAAGNEGIELGDYGPGGNDNVLTVGATHVDDRGAGFANFGEQVDVAAPGVDVLSLRARFTDANFRPGLQAEGEYEIGQNVVGDDKRYLRASGTSFSAPIVTGVASLMLSKDPGLSGVQAGQLIEQTAMDVDVPGKDRYTGHGMVDARAALSADAGFFVTSEISDVQLAPAEAPAVARVMGTVDASRFKRAWVQIGPGENPGGWRYVGQKRKYPIREGLIATIPIAQFAGYDTWLVVVNVEDANGVLKRAAHLVEIP